MALLAFVTGLTFGAKRLRLVQVIATRLLFSSGVDLKPYEV